MVQQPQDQSPPDRNRVLAALRELLEIIRDFGMPIIAFGTGIYAFLLLLEVPMATELKAAVALGLTLLGIGAQLWTYSRTNPRVQANEVREQLARMTDLVERLVDDSLKR